LWLNGGFETERSRKKCQGVSLKEKSGARMRRERGDGLKGASRRLATVSRIPPLRKKRQIASRWGFEAEPPPTYRRKRRQDGAGRGRSRAGGSKQEVCDRKPNPPSPKETTDCEQMGIRSGAPADLWHSIEKNGVYCENKTGTDPGRYNPS
jgi:hypothetical protein